MVDTRRAGVLLSALNLTATLSKRNKAQMDASPLAPAIAEAPREPDPLLAPDNEALMTTAP